MVLLIVQVRSEYAYKKRFSVPTLKIRGKSPLQHFEVWHEKFITHFLFCSYSRIWINILLFKNFKLRKIRRATVDMAINVIGRRWVTVLFSSSFYSSRCHSDIVAAASTSKIIATVSCIQNITIFWFSISRK